jgi:hypothetical protein
MQSIRGEGAAMERLPFVPRMRRTLTREVVMSDPPIEAAERRLVHRLRGAGALGRR